MGDILGEVILEWLCRRERKSMPLKADVAMGAPAAPASPSVAYISPP